MIVHNRVRVAMTAAVAVTAALLFSGVAAADGHGGGTATGSGSTPLFTIDFDVTQHSADPTDAEGYFAAEAIPPAGGLIAPQGPATCVDVRGDKVGFLYPLAEGSRPAALVGQFILITAQDNGPGRQDAVGFLGPAPEAAFPGCAPNVATLPLTEGDIEVHPAG